MKNEIKKLEHSSYRCQYHIVFAPKYRRKVIYGELKADIGNKTAQELINEQRELLKYQILDSIYEDLDSVLTRSCYAME